MIFKRLIYLLLLSPLFFSCGSDEKKNTQQNSQIDSLSLDRGRISHTRKDSVQDNIAQMLAGLPQPHPDVYSEIEKKPFWISYKKRMDASWEKLKTERLNPIAQWDTSFFGKKINDTLPLLYPFSGPDFVHAYHLYPRTTTYILLALEPISEMPNIEKLNTDNQKLYFNSLENSLQDVFKKSYFITTHMQNDLSKAKVKGVLPLFYFFIARSGLEILQVNQVTIDTSGKVIKVPQYKGKGIKGIHFIVKNPETNFEKDIYYFSCNLSNTGMNFNPELGKFLDNLGQVNVFLKSASYMPHYSTFKTIREKILAHAASILEDDTGIPYKYFKNKIDWKVTLFGTYAEPVKDFGKWVFQKDLDSAYADSSKIKQLPFHLGYHWGDKKQSYLLLQKNTK